MDHSVMRRALTAAAAVTATLAATFAGLAGPARADTSPDAAQTQVKIAKSTGMYGDGAVIVVDVTSKCAPGADESYVYVRVTQADGPFGTVSGDGGASLQCTGSAETVPVAVPGYAPFHTGLAFASAEIQICSEFECTTAETSREVKVTTGTREVPRYRSADLTYRLPADGQILGGGAGATVLVPYTCAAGLYGGFEAALAQATSDGYVNTSGDSTELRCTETSRSGVLAFHAGISGWVAADAFLLVNGITCSDAEGCSNGSTYRSIRLS